MSVNNIWAFERMYTYSSFKGAYWSKYHRIIFNLFAICMVLLNTFASKEYDQLNFLIAHTAMVVAFTLYVIILRPYRCWSTNTVYIIAMIGFSLQVIALTGSTLLNQSEDSNKLSEQETFFLKISLSAIIFCAVIIAFIAIVVISAIKRVRWPVDTSYLEGKEVGIAALADARQFLKDEEEKEFVSERL